ncbi:hypothetical protein DS6A_31 [Mycobacterium phage DS6A]|uniref:Lysin B n=1 Tax=Mycobacterium phage DS6A TaxID=45764 RepID=G8I4E1_9CAUD|nr:hypothetical protein DS6A_31 [Mycobacterium phage DS6A]AER47585.1 hypothetical protein DS6A_31 [Mycobacterium phage DS6A]
MTWIGWQQGMAGEPVAAAKRELRRKFSYAKHLDDSDVFDLELLAVLIEYQQKKNATGYTPRLREDGVLDWATQVAIGTVQTGPPPKAGTLFTVQGTGVDMWTGPPADTARAVEGDWEWQPIGNYPASPFPMWASIWQGIEELRFQIRRHATEKPGKAIALAGFSQGAVVVSWVYKWDIALPGGMLHDLLPQVAAGVTWGNPMAEKGKFHGNRFAGWPVPAGMGINRDRLENTPALWLDFGHGRNSPWGQDIYCDRPDNLAGQDMELICDLVMAQDLWRFVTDFAVKAGNVMASPETELPAILDAVTQAGMFFIVNRTAPHLTYDVGPAIDYLRQVARDRRLALAA